MSGGFIGLDVEAVRSMAGNLDSSAESVDVATSAISALMNQVMWAGGDFDELVEMWQAQLGPSLQQAAEDLRNAGTRARENVDAQETASNDLGGGSGAGVGFWEGVGNWLGDRAGDLWDFGKDAGNWLGDRAGDLWDFGKDAGNWLGDRAGDLWDFGGDVLGWVGNQAGNSLGAIADDWANVGDHLGNFWDATGGALLNGEVPRVTEVAASMIGVAGSGAGAVLTTATYGALEANVFDDGNPYAGPATPVAKAGDPKDLADYMEYVTNAYDNEGTVRITTVTDAHGNSSYVVSVPGTESWWPGAGGNPMDVTGNIVTAGGSQSTMSQAVMMAIEQNVPPGANVMLVGHSQGGMTAVDVAADPAFADQYNVTNVVTYGSPVENTTVPPGTNVLNLQHDSDLVPKLDLNGLRVDGSQAPTNGSNVTTVTFDNPPQSGSSWVGAGAGALVGSRLPGVGLGNGAVAGSDVLNALTNHSHEKYSTSVSDSKDPALQQYLDDPSMSQYFTGDGGRSTVVEVEVGRRDR